MRSKPDPKDYPFNYVVLIGDKQIEVGSYRSAELAIGSGYIIDDEWQFGEESHLENRPDVPVRLIFESADEQRAWKDLTNGYSDGSDEGWHSFVRGAEYFGYEVNNDITDEDERWEVAFEIMHEISYEEFNRIERHRDAYEKADIRYREWAATADEY